MSFTTNCSVPTQVSHPVFRQPRMHCTGTFNLPLNYQAALLRRALSVDPFPNPDGHGWQVLAPNHATDPTAIPVLVPKWMSEPAAPERVLELVSCKCTTGFTTQRCRCRKANLHCSAACSCTNCSNSTEEGSVAGNDTMSGPWTMILMNKKINCEAFSVFCVSRHVLHDLVFKWRARCCLS